MAKRGGSKSASVKETVITAATATTTTTTTSKHTNQQITTKHHHRHHHLIDIFRFAHRSSPTALPRPTSAAKMLCPPRSLRFPSEAEEHRTFMGSCRTRATCAGLQRRLSPGQRTLTIATIRMMMTRVSEYFLTDFFLDERCVVVVFGWRV